MELGSTTFRRWMSIRRRFILNGKHLSYGCPDAAVRQAVRSNNALTLMMIHVIKSPLKLRDGVAFTGTTFILTSWIDGFWWTYTHVRRIFLVRRSFGATRVIKHNGHLCSLREHYCFDYLNAYCMHNYSYYMNVRRSYFYRSYMICYTYATS